MKKNVVLCLCLACLVGVFVSVVGCKRQDVKHDAVASFVDEPSVRDDFDVNENVKTVYFAFDKSNLNADSLNILQENAKYLSENPSMKVVVEGNTDNRGTAEYNLALGQRRALAVKEEYVKLGIEPERIATISYGLEKPAIDENNKAAWSKNRRAETKTQTKSL